MPIGDPYVSSADLKKAISIDAGETYADADIDRALAAASAAVEELTNRRTFWKDETPTTRVFTATSAQFVRIDDLVSVDSVTSDGTAVTDYVTEPLNANADGQPYSWLSADRPLFDCGRGKISVTGVFGWPEVPAQVEQMVAILASKLLRRTREAPFGVINIGGMAGDAVRMGREDPDVQLLVKRLARAVVA